MTDETKQKEYYTYLCGIMLKTSRARFFAAKSLRAKDRASLIVSALLSIALISISLSQLAGLPKKIVSANDGMTILSIIAAIGLLSQTLIDWALARSVLSEKLHDNALQITRTLREMERELAKSAPNYDILATLASRYEDINILTGVNHSDWDYAMTVRDGSVDHAALKCVRRKWHSTIHTIFIAFSSALGGASLVLVVVGGLYLLL